MRSSTYNQYQLVPRRRKISYFKLTAYGGELFVRRPGVVFGLRQPPMITRLLTICVMTSLGHSRAWHRRPPTPPQNKSFSKFPKFHSSQVSFFHSFLFPTTLPALNWYLIKYLRLLRYFLWIIITAEKILSFERWSRGNLVRRYKYVQQGDARVQ